MAGYIRQLRDSMHNNMYPVTSAKAVYINTTDTVERVLNDLEDTDSTLRFKDGEITNEKKSGSVVTTRFGNGVITEVTKDKDGNIVKTKTITIRNDGTITIKVEGSDDGL